MAKEKETVSREREMTLLGHLDELRTRLIICVGALLVSVIACFFVAQPVLEFLVLPVSRLVKHAPPEPDEKVIARTVLVDAETGEMKFQHPEILQKLDKIDHLQVVFVMNDDAGTTFAGPAIGGNPFKTTNIIYSRPFDSVLMPLKVAVVMGIFISLGVWIWQIWLFIKPGLTDKEIRVVRPMLGGAVFLFPLGAAFAYGMFFLVMRVMQNYALSSIETLYTIQDYLKVMTNMMIVFGFIFELPLVIAVLSRVGIVTPELLKHYRRHIYVFLAFVAMIVTPADPYSMMIAFVPLIGLFELSVLISRPMALLKRQADEEDDVEEGAA